MEKVSFGSTPQEMDELANLVCTGVKTATSSLYSLYQTGIKKRSKIGDYFSVVNSANKEVALVRIEKIEIIKIKDITDDFAKEEGDGSLENWTAIHKPYYSRLLSEIGEVLCDDTMLVCEWFKKAVYSYSVKEAGNSFRFVKKHTIIEDWSLNYLIPILNDVNSTIKNSKVDSVAYSNVEVHHIKGCAYNWMISTVLNKIWKKSEEEWIDEIVLNVEIKVKQYYLQLDADISFGNGEWIYQLAPVIMEYKSDLELSDLVENFNEPITSFCSQSIDYIKKGLSIIQKNAI